MTTELWIRDVGAFSLQLTAIIAAGAAVAFACRVRRPGATLFYWRGLLLACVVLPLCQSWRVEPPSGPEASFVEATAATSSSSTTPLTIDGRPGRVESSLLAVLIAGILLRAAWLAIGALALRRLRRGASPAGLPEAIRAAQSRLGVRGRILIADRASGPMTFGLFRPVVILPSDVADLAPHIQEAITYHELIHVRRRDWLAGLAEELVRTILWFHPAVWWLVGRIRLSREQVVDREVIRFAESREHYVDALLVMALRHSPLTLMPAPTFLRRSLLKKRVAHIMQETTMTTRRLITSLAASTAVVGLAGVLAVRSFPLQAQSAAAAPAGAPVQVVRGGDHLLHGDLPEYPARAIDQKVEGDVVLDVAVDDRGEVSDVRVATGPDELRRAALESVLRWHYAKAAVSNTSTQVVLRFHLPPPGAASGDAEFVSSDGRRVKVRFDESQLKEQTEHQIVELRQAFEDPRTSAEEKAELKLKYADAVKRMDEIHAQGTVASGESERIGFGRTADGTERLTRIRRERATESTVSEILAQAHVEVGDVVTEDSLKRLQEIASKEDEHIRVESGHDAGGGLVLTFITR